MNLHRNLPENYPDVIFDAINKSFKLNLLPHFKAVLFIWDYTGINIRSLPGSSDMSDQRLFIKDLVPGSVADVCGLIQPMDQIIAVNGRCIVHLNKDESLKMLKQHDQVHVTFLREVEPLPFSVNNTKSDSSINQPSKQERMMLYRETLSNKFEVSQGEVLFYDLKTQMKQFQARDGSTSYM